MAERMLLVARQTAEITSFERTVLEEVAIIEGPQAPVEVADAVLVRQLRGEVCFGEPRQQRLNADRWQHPAEGPARGVARLAAYLDAQVQGGLLRIPDTTLAAQHFLHLCLAGLLTRLLFAAGGMADEARKRFQVAEAVRVFLAGYGADAST